MSNVRAHDYNFEDEIDLLFFEYSRFRDDFQERETKNTRKTKKTKKNRPFLQTKTRSMMLRLRQSHHRLLFLFWCFFLILVSFLFLPSCSNAQEEEGKCPLDIAKIDLSGLGNACGNAADTGMDPYFFYISFLILNFHRRVVREMHHVSRSSDRKRGVHEGRIERVAIRYVRDGESVDVIGKRSDDRFVFESFSLPARRFRVRERYFSRRRRRYWKGGSKCLCARR